MGSADQIRRLTAWLVERKKSHPDLLILVDPVIGDVDSGVYVKPGIPEAYRELLLPLAQGITPNLFELSVLTGLPCHTLDEAIYAAKTLLSETLKWVVITSAPGDSAQSLSVVTVSAGSVDVVQHERVVTSLKGTGDLFCAELLCCLLAGQSIAASAEYAANRVFEVIQWTQQHQYDELVLPAQ